MKTKKKHNLKNIMLKTFETCQNKTKFIAHRLKKKTQTNNKAKCAENLLIKIIQKN